MKKLDDIPELKSLSGSEWSDDEDDEDADDEGESTCRGYDSDGGAPCQYKWVQGEIEAMYAHRYEMARDTLLHGPSYLHHVLLTLKHEHPDHFREALRVSPPTFDKLVDQIEHDPVFANNSTCAQMPVETQLAITLYRFGHDGNAASIQNIANWARVSKGIIHIITRRVMVALLQPQFMQMAVHFPTPAKKEQAKDWVQAHSCKAWRGGWCFVDGTLVPLSNRPFWFGESYFDRKCNYSLNIQIVSLPNLCIIDFSYRHTSSTHDSSAWEDTCTAQDHDTLLEKGEWVWADSAYPISVWVVAPYKQPERDHPENDVFNNHVSMLRICSEHAIGFLKGRFHSLKNLRVAIKDKDGHKIATYWVAAWVAVHAFAMQHEANERSDDESDAAMRDPFISEGLSSDSGSESDWGPPARPVGTTRLQAGKAHQQKLKEQLFCAKARRAERRR